ncbi:MAG: hypothetical protein LW809_01890 [Vampirovibrionales bacterium]|jgi:hypothetical protein|nr:hypothetical protein [Vampirovibrionales bacterium]
MNFINTAGELFQSATKMIQPAKLKGAADEVAETTSALAIRPKSVMPEFQNAIVPSNFTRNLDPAVIDVEYTVVDDAANAVVPGARQPQPYRFAKDQGLVNAEYAGTHPSAINNANSNGVVRIPESSITDAVPQTQLAPASTSDWGGKIQRATTDAKNAIVSTGNQLRTYTDEQYEIIAKNLGKTREEAIAFTKEHPEAAVTIALGTGFTTGAVVL